MKQKVRLKVNASGFIVAVPLTVKYFKSDKKYLKYLKDRR